MSIEITDPDPDDAAEIFFVQRQTWHESYLRYLTHEEIEQRFTDSPERIQQIREFIEDTENSKYFIAKDEDKIVGFISLFKKSENEIKSLYVLEQYQGSGIGKKLILKGIEWFEGDAIFVHTDEDNREAQSFYKKFGFQFLRKLPSTEREGFDLIEMKRE